MGLIHLLRDVEDPQIRDSVVLGVIPYASEAHLLESRLIPLAEFQPPTLEADGVTRLDLAFEEVRQSLDRDIRRPVVGAHRGDYRPTILVFTDGAPTDAEGNRSDNWRPPRDSVLADVQGGAAPHGTVRVYNVVAIGTGNVDEETLKEIRNKDGIALKSSDPDIAFRSYLQLTTMASLLPMETGAGAGAAGSGPVLTADMLPPDQRAVLIP
jgi:uncharacterized protein YegL